MELKVTKVPDENLNLNNTLYVNPTDYKGLVSLFPKTKNSFPDKTTYVLVKDFVFLFDMHEGVPKGQIAVNGIIRQIVSVSIGVAVKVDPFIINSPSIILSTLNFSVETAFPKKSLTKLDVETLEQAVMSNFRQHFFGMGSTLVCDVNGTPLKFTCTGLTISDVDFLGEPTDKSIPVDTSRGILEKITTMVFTKGPGAAIEIKGASSSSHELGVGGLDEEFATLFRRAFASRLYPPSVINQFGIQHVKGILLYGPPGTGKSLLAGKIGNMLNGKKPKIVNGPELLSKFVGEGEKNLRELFADAEKEYAERGDESDLHVLIFDELDALFRERGSRSSGSSGLGDTIVNQMLSKMDGVEKLNNILVIGMTNRKDMLDPALLRAGRMSVHIEVHLPNEHGRVQILEIHTKQMRSSGRLGSDVNIPELASKTKNYSGSELAELVKAAASFALSKHLDASNLKKAPIDESSIKVTMVEFEDALHEVKPDFGVSEAVLDRYIANGVWDYSDEFKSVQADAQAFVTQAMKSAKTGILSVLISGKPGSGKTAFVASLAKNSGFNFVKMMAPDNLISYQETARAYKIQSLFEDAHKSPSSMIVIDDIERLIDYVNIGPRFSNAVLQTLLVFLKKPISPEQRMMIVATTSKPDLMAKTGILENMNFQIELPNVTGPKQFNTIIQKHLKIEGVDVSEVVSENQSMPVKKLIMVSEMLTSSGVPSTKLNGLFGKALNAQLISEKKQKQSFLHSKEDEEDD